MTEQNTLLVSGVVGAAVGVAVGFMFFTARGQAWRQDAEANLDVLVREAEHLMSTLGQVRQGIAELRSGPAPAGWPRTA